VSKINLKADQIITKGEGNKLFIFEVYRKEILKRINSGHQQAPEWKCTMGPVGLGSVSPCVEMG
jgi:hypothetical protein